MTLYRHSTNTDDEVEFTHSTKSSKAKFKRVRVATEEEATDDAERMSEV
jgi:hypothetical protein